MTITTADKAKTIREHQSHERDCGSTKVQIALLTERIRSLTDHLKPRPKDNHTRAGLLKLVGRRNRLLRYLRSVDADGYAALIEALDIRGVRTNV